MVSISIHLFGKPEWELGEKITPKNIKAKGDELKTRLYEVADAMQKLSAEKWKHEFNVYEIVFTKKLSKQEAKKELEKLGIRKDVYELEEDEEGED